ncbi:entericidin A/B family lipoprotein [Noviherbaspirillum sp.]
MKKYYAMLISALILMGCNTMQGVGRDVQLVGEKVESAAKR